MKLAFRQADHEIFTSVPVSVFVLTFVQQDSANSLMMSVSDNVIGCCVDYHLSFVCESFVQKIVVNCDLLAAVSAGSLLPVPMSMYNHFTAQEVEDQGSPREVLPKSWRLSILGSQ